MPLTAEIEAGAGGGGAAPLRVGPGREAGAAERLCRALTSRRTTKAVFCRVFVVHFLIVRTTNNFFNNFIKFTKNIK
jgi:hypothetical protein